MSKPLVTRPMMRCTNCKRWQSGNLRNHGESTPIPRYVRATDLPDADREGFFDDEKVMVIPRDVCGGCGAPLEEIDMTAHLASLPQGKE